MWRRQLEEEVDGESRQVELVEVEKPLCARVS